MEYNEPAGKIIDLYLMKFAHLAKLTVFSYEHENEKAILDSFLGFFPFGLDENKAKLSRKNAIGFNDSKIIIFEVTLAKQSLISQFIKNLTSNLSEEQKKILSSQMDSRLDQNLDFFVRFDKDSWVNGKKLELTDSGRCFHLKMSIAAFPKKRNIAFGIISEMLK